MMRNSETIAKENSKNRRTLARLRESRAAINFALPSYDRLNETYSRPRRTYHPINFQPDNDQLCSNCATLDLPTIFREGLKNETRDDGIQVRKGIPLGYSDEIYARASCPFCRLLVNIGDSNFSGDERDVEYWWMITLRGHEVLLSTMTEPLYEIKCFDFDDNQELYRSLQTEEEAIYLALVRVVKPPPRYRFEYRTIFQELGHLGLLMERTKEESDSLLPDNLSLRNTTGDPEELTERIRKWLLRCCGKHKICSSEATKRTADRPDGFRLFDITALKVVDDALLGHEPYVALSYPWSHIDPFEIKRDDEPYDSLEDLPEVLQDVIGLVRRLGFGVNHFWMDKLCIDPDDDEQRTANINAMGDIYGAAFVTIVLAVPSRRYLEQGVPGLSAIPRLPYQRIETIGNLQFATTYPSLEMTIATSEWNTRAWTFQEGLLSTRCILFGPEQVYFECAEMSCCESIMEPNFEQHNHLIPYKSRLRNPFLDNNYNFDSLYWRLVRDYTSRNMSLESDSLNAFAAFTTEFERGRTAGSSRQQQQQQQQQQQHLTWGLPLSSSVLHLLWEHEPWNFNDIHRRDEFPSWSWAGWSGTAAMNFQLDSSSGPGARKVNFTYTISSSRSRRNRILICNARSVKVTITGQFPNFFLAGASESSSSIILDRGMNFATISEDDLPSKCLMMEICQESEFVHGLLVVMQKDNNIFFERIGSGFMKLTDFENAELVSRELKLV